MKKITFGHCLVMFSIGMCFYSTITSNNAWPSAAFLLISVCYVASEARAVTMDYFKANGVLIERITECEDQIDKIGASTDSIIKLAEETKQMMLQSKMSGALKR